MQSTAKVERLIEVMIGELGDSPRADQVVAVTRAWLSDDVIVMNDEQLKGALVALQLIELRRPHFDLPAYSLQAVVMDVGATLVLVNRAVVLDEGIAEAIAGLEAYNTLTGEDGNGSPEDD